MYFMLLDVTINDIFKFKFLLVYYPWRMLRQYMWGKAHIFLLLLYFIPGYMLTHKKKITMFFTSVFS